jgi:hypothetical protein
VMACAGTWEARVASVRPFGYFIILIRAWSCLINEIYIMKHRIPIPVSSTPQA